MFTYAETHIRLREGMDTSDTSLTLPTLHITPLSTPVTLQERKERRRVCKWQLM